MYKVFITSCFLLLAFSVKAQLTEEAKFALLEQNVSLLESKYKNASDEEKLCIIDAMCNNRILWDNLTYEQILTIESNESSDDPFYKILRQQLQQKEKEILNCIDTLDAERIDMYCQLFPKRAALVAAYLNNVLTNHLDSIPYVQLDYLYRNLHITGYEVISKAYDSRVEERYALLRSKVIDYCQIEASYRDRLVFLLQAGAWLYLYNRFEGVAKSYSQIGVVSDEPYYIGSQFRQIVLSYFTSADFSKQLNNIVKSYNANINKARAKYASSINITNYPISDIKAPAISSFSYSDDYDILCQVPKARASFVESRQTASTVASIASFFVGSLYSTIGKGLFDLYAASSLAESEIGARKELMDDVYNKLRRIIDSYCSNVSANIDKQISDNQTKFIDYVKKQQ